MDIFNDISKRRNPCCVALGFFDGVHVGHRALLTSMIRYAAEHSLTSCVFTFSKPPSAVLSPGKASSGVIMTENERIDAVAALGADVCFDVDFDRFKNISAEDFVKKILVGQLNAAAVFCGFNFRFGKNAEGNTETLHSLCAELGVRLFVTPPVYSGEDIVSSSRIRRLIEDGKIFDANRLMRRPFAISGEVVHGLQNGRSAGIPTLNQLIPSGRVMPRFGAYASFAVIGGKRLRAVTNIGVRPTVSGSGVNCETHILDEFGRDIYGENVCTQLLWFERGERKFESLDALALQIRADIDHIEQLDIYERYISGDDFDGC